MGVGLDLPVSPPVSPETLCPPPPPCDYGCGLQKTVGAYGYGYRIKKGL